MSRPEAGPYRFSAGTRRQSEPVGICLNHRSLAQSQRELLSLPPRHLRSDLASKLRSSPVRAANRNYRCFPMQNPLGARLAMQARALQVSQPPDRLRTELGRPSKTVPQSANGCYPLYARTADGDETVLSQRSAGRGLPEAAIIAALAKGTVLAIAD